MLVRKYANRESRDKLRFSFYFKSDDVATPVKTNQTNILNDIHIP